MSDELLLSLCIPTNGVCEWVKPVLDSIYAEENPIGDFEVVVTDNGGSQQFCDMMSEYCLKYSNLVYKRTDAAQFTNQIEAFKLAKGKLIKFVNHRMMLLPGALNYLLQFVIDNEKEKPFVYFLDNECAGVYSDFEQYVKGLSYWSSYSGGTAMWKSDLENIDLSKPFSELFPHIDLIFGKKHAKEYIVDGHQIMKSLLFDETKKGQYNLFFAFAVEYPSIILKLYKEKYISIDTFHAVKKNNFEFIAGLYLDYIILKKPCSYDLSNYKENISVFYNTKEIYFKIFRILINKVKGLVKRLINIKR